MDSRNHEQTHAISRTLSPLRKHSRTSSLTLYSGIVLEKVCEYFYYNEKYKDAKDVPDMDIPTELSIELLMAADYLDGTVSPSEALN